MELNILVFDDEATSVVGIFQNITKHYANINNLSKGAINCLEQNRFFIPSANDQTINIACNLIFADATTISEAIDYIDNELPKIDFDLVLIDDNWKKGGGRGNFDYAGQKKLLPHAYKLITNTYSELPVFSLFTRHFEEYARLGEFDIRRNQLWEKDGKDLRKNITAISKTSGSVLELMRQTCFIKSIAVKKYEITQRLEKIDVDGVSLSLERISIPEAQSDFKGPSKQAQSIRDDLGEIAEGWKQAGDFRNRAGVILLGETGVGKEVAARELHRLSGRTGPFLTVRCNEPALDLAHFRNTLFGATGGVLHDRKPSEGIFKEAAGGTIFFNEIHYLNKDAQAVLLGPFDAGEIYPIGSSKPITFDPNIVIISATNRNIEEMVEQNLFKEDLFYRLAGRTVWIPPLRERPEDIMPLLNFLIKEALPQNKRHYEVEFSPEAEKSICNFFWRGNIRELNQLALAISQFASRCQLPGNIIPINLQILKEHIKVDFSKKRLMSSPMQTSESAVELPITLTASTNPGGEADNITYPHWLDYPKLEGRDPKEKNRWPKFKEYANALWWVLNELKKDHPKKCEINACLSKKKGKETKAVTNAMTAPGNSAIWALFIHTQRKAHPETAEKLQGMLCEGDNGRIARKLQLLES